ncbi:MAG: Fe-S cluster assembly protein NifU [Candidatus Sumerlaeota bacterium]|nr:Fe-S cluster assembly protein NifU [Candidatus Sumerlaeota bacterium]
MWNYTDKVMDHFANPRNVGEIKDPDAVGEVGSLACGDALRLMLKVDSGERIEEAKFQTFGCASAIASASALTEMILGMKIDEAARVTNQDIANYLGGLPEQKMHCSVLGREALEMAIHNYRTGEVAVARKEGEIVCVCFGVTDKEIERVVRENSLTTVEQVTNYCKAGGGCGGCHGQIEKIIEKIKGEAAAAAPKRPKGKLTTIQKIALIQETIDREIRPGLKQDRGDIELIDIEGAKVIVALRGSCSSCPVSGVTLRDFVQAKLREFVSEDIEVVEEHV